MSARCQAKWFGVRQMERCSNEMPSEADLIRVEDATAGQRLRVCPMCARSGRFTQVPETPAQDGK